MFALRSLSQTAANLVHFRKAGRTLDAVPPPYPSGNDLPASEALRADTVCILVNWNGADDTLACLRSLETQTDRDFAVIVVDNGSTDDSRERIETYLLGRSDGAIPMQLVESGANLGFSGGNNIGIRAAAALRPRFLWLLNNDTIVPPDTLAKLVQTAQLTPEVGLVGSVLYYLHEPQRVQAWGGGRMRPSIAYATHYFGPHAFGAGDYLTFASVLVRAEVLRAIGLLDERFFMYYEDAEFCLRAQAAGWGLAVAADTAVLHREGGSRNVHRSLPLERTRTASALMLIRLHGAHPSAGMAFFLLARLGKKLLKMQWNEIQPVVLGAWVFFTTQ